MLAQGIVEYSALTSLAEAVQRVSMLAQDWIRNVDSRVLWFGGVIVVVWVGRKLLS